MARGSRWKLVTAILVLGVTSPIAKAQSVSTPSISFFRHDGGRAIDAEQSLPAELDEAHQLWSQPLPPGHSTPTIVGDRILLTGYEGPELLTICLERSTGKLLWRQAIKVDEFEKFHPQGSPAAASVASDGTRAFSFFGSFGLAAYGIDGKPLWTRKLGPFRDEFGSASSPILAKGLVILNEDHDLDSYLLAVKQETGETAWQTPREGFTRSYATPVLCTVNGQTQLVIAGSLQLVAYDVATGKQLWSRDGFARIVNTTPAVGDDLLYVATWSPGGDTDARVAMETWSAATQMWDVDKNGALAATELPDGEVRTRFFRIDLNGNDELDEKEWTKYAKIFELAQNNLVALRPDPAGGAPQIVWEYKRGLPYVASPIVYRNQVFLVKDGGVVTVLAADTGKLIKQTRARGEGNYYATPAAGDGKIYIASVNGVITVFQVGEKKTEILSSRDFGQRIAATPVVLDGRIYLRTESALYCFGAK